METKTTLLKMSLLALLLFISSTAFSATYYMCSGSTITLSDPPVDANLTYTWDVKLGGTSVSTYPGSPGKPTGMPSAAGTYTVTLTSTSANPNICAPDVAEHTMIVLPALTLTISTPTNPTYCGSATTHSSVITPTQGGFPTGGTFAADLETELSYAVTKDGVTVTPTAYGTITAGVYTLNTTTIGVYKITATVKYKQKGTNVLLGSTGCPTTTTEQTITVTSAPGAPTITVS